MIVDDWEMPYVGCTFERIALNAMHEPLLASGSRNRFFTHIHDKLDQNICHNVRLHRAMFRWMLNLDIMLLHSDYI